MRTLLSSIAFFAALFVTLPIAAFADPTLLTINVPVTFKNIDREFDSFQIICQIQYQAPNQVASFTNAFTTTQKLVNRGFSGNVVEYWTDAAAVQYGHQVVCYTNFLLSTNPATHYDPDAVNQTGSAAAAPLPGAPQKTRFTLNLP